MVVLPYNGLSKEILELVICNQGSPHFVNTGRLKDKVRGNLGDFRKASKLFMFLSPYDGP